MAVSGSMDGSLRQLALEALSAPVAQPASDASLARLRELGTLLWLDTGNREEAASLWHREFSALTTNNTLANQVVQTGVLDEVARGAVKAIKAGNPGISQEDLAMELGFVVNCHVALRLVKAFGAYVSVELHPAVGEDLDRTVAYAHRYFAICPERFIIKIPLTPEGYCAVARVCAAGVPVNYTLGFSARQNYLAAVVANPTYCNVFLGRLNAVVSDNGLGDGRNVGEKASMATQNALRALRAEGKTVTKLIAASMRSASQVSDLAGTDVYTMPPKVAKEFMAAAHAPASIQAGFDTPFDVETTNPAAVAALWDIDPQFVAMCESLRARGGANLQGSDLRAADKEFGTGLFHDFTPEERDVVRTDGKIPVVAKWSGVGLDDLMTQAALQSFTVDQAALDSRLMRLAAEVG